ncbi:MAG: hypothetical protein FWC27_13220 [Firmicutes bacterium]|nr:hypothetical protein [Bacillota bacterium]
MLARLQAPLKVLKRKAGKEIEKRLARAKELSAYENEEEAHEAYGNGYITFEEYDAIRERFDHAEPGSAAMSAAEAALDELQGIIHRLQREIRDLKWSALPEEEKQRIQTGNDAYREKLQRSKGGVFDSQQLQ